MFWAVAAIVVIALFFDYTNGFHDAANAIATSVGTRALRPRVALTVAAIANLAGALVSTGVAKTVQSFIDPPDGAAGLAIIAAALLGAISWNLITWRLGLPSSSTHSLVGGLVGAALAGSATVKWSAVVEKAVIPMVTSPIIGFVLAFLVMTLILWIFARRRYGAVSDGFRRLQPVSATALAFGHGLQDAQKTMGVILLALTVGGYSNGEVVPLWVKVSAATAIGLGTYSGGWRIMRTLGRRVIKLDPARGFAAEITAASVLYISAFVYKAPISTTHIVSSAVMGVGATKRFSAVRWGVAGNIMTAWILTIPAAAIIAALVEVLLRATLV